MRQVFAQTIISQCNTEEHVFITGDLGFMALEEVKKSFADRFINAGISEQNMIGVAAGLAREGFKVFCYSIAPFCYARPFEQIRNDISFGALPVCIVGNGGGYAYGHMGPTHHALEDCAAMTALGLKVYIPAFDDDLEYMLRNICTPTYLRLGYQILPQNQNAPKYAPIRCCLDGENGALVALGPLAGQAWQSLRELTYSMRPSVWAISELPLIEMPSLFYESILNKPLVVIEEHVKSGGLGQQLSSLLFSKQVHVSTFIHKYALGYPSNTYGSQNFHRKECSLDADSIKNIYLLDKLK